MTSNSQITAIYPGTFDPVTLGHIDIIKRAAKIFPHLIIAVADDSAKQPIFSLEQRVEMLQDEIGRIKCDSKIEAKSFSGLLVDYAKKMNAQVLVRGLRAASDFEYEFQLAYMNYKLDHTIETVFIPASSKGHFISSRFVKQIARLGGDISNFVSPKIEQTLKDYYAKNN